MIRTEHTVAQCVPCPVPTCRQPVRTDCRTASDRRASQPHSARIRAGYQALIAKPWVTP